MEKRWYFMKVLDEDWKFRNNDECPGQNSEAAEDHFKRLPFFFVNTSFIPFGFWCPGFDHPQFFSHSKVRLISSTHTPPKYPILFFFSFSLTWKHLFSTCHYLLDGCFLESNLKKIIFQSLLKVFMTNNTLVLPWYLTFINLSWKK